MRLFALLCFLPLAALAGGLDPWSLGMTKDQVLALSDRGPYKSFSNGDLETYSGIFLGRKANVQFYFRDGALRRIAVLTYEGTDPNDASATWLETYRALREKFGDIETPGLSGEGQELMVQARVRIELGLKAQMAPKKQPPDEFYFSTFSKDLHDGKAWYRVVVNIDPPHR